jgi:phosphoribosylglycinamide formyltransferase 1
MNRDALRVVILVSGRGSNMQALLDAHAGGDLPLDIRAVISNRPAAPALERARAAGVNAEIVDHRAYTDRESFDQALMAAIDRHEPGLVVLAGFMRILTDAFIHHYHDRLLNIHPSLLPDLPGLHTHARALAEGRREHGATVHFVTPELDAGPGVLQARVPVRADDDAATLAARVLRQEHRIYPRAVGWFAAGRLHFDGATVWLDGEPLTRPVMDTEGLDETAH